MKISLRLALLFSLINVCMNAQNFSVTLIYSDLKFTDNWIVTVNNDTTPLKLYSDSSLIMHIVNPKVDFLVFKKIGGTNTKGKIEFSNGEGKKVEFPLPIEKYKRGETVVVKLADVAKNYRKSAVNGLKIQFIDNFEKTHLPIIQVVFNIDK